MAIAPATPAILPVPTVPASAVQTAWNGVIAPSAASFLWNMRPMVVLSAKGNLRICRKPVRTLSSSPTPIMQTIAGTPQTKSLTTLLMAAIVSKNMGESILSGTENTLFYQIAGRGARAGDGGMCGKTAKVQDGGHRKPSRRQKCGEGRGKISCSASQDSAFHRRCCNYGRFHPPSDRHKSRARR